MKLLLGIVIAILSTIAVSERPSVALDPMNWSAQDYSTNPNYIFATSKDLLVFNEHIIPVKRDTTSLGQSVMTIRRRNDEGVYVPVGTFSDYPSPYASTNGKWVITFSKGLVLFNIDSDNVISDPSFIYTIGGYVLSDDTVVGYDPISENQDGNYTIRTYQYESSNNTWINIPGTELIVTTSVSGSGLQGDFSSYRATDTHLVFADTTDSDDFHVKIYERQANKSWKFIESVPVNSSLNGGSVNYNGVDTLTFAFSSFDTGGNGTGILFVYTKSNGKWTEQSFTTLSVGYRPQGLFGAVTNFVDASTLLVSSPGEGYIFSEVAAPTNAGKVLVMTRTNDSAWEPSFDLAHPSGEGLFGLALGVNYYDVIVLNSIFPATGPSESLSTLTFYSTPRCTLQPINVHCNDQQVNDCSQLNVSSLYTINTQCGEITATLNGLSLVDNKAVEAQFSFTNGGRVTSCTSTVTCPVPPVVIQPPSSISGASALEFGLASLFLVALFM